jgi:hypothetical protein
MLGQWYPGEYTTAPANCGADPCDFTDYFDPSDQCAAWLQCAGQPAVTFSNILAQGTSSIVSGTANVIGAGVTSAVSNPTTDILIVALVIGAIGIWILLDKL